MPLTKSSAAFAALVWKVFEDRLEQPVDQTIGGLELDAFPPRLAVDADADLDLVFGEGEARLAGVRHDAGRQGEPHRACIGIHALRDGDDLVERIPPFGSGAGIFSTRRSPAPLPNGGTRSTRSSPSRSA